MRQQGEVCKAVGEVGGRLGGVELEAEQVGSGGQDVSLWRQVAHVGGGEDLRMGEL